ncbi:MAG: 23S rRNA (guanosine(2251)-2'-O)-methyltransferase RlmB [Flavobacteriales bacterium]|nr:23S rRNA (guanosine(2251)-2'-O)-methyltransferase RlmB [Flavobacteriales bacterium]|tara:strand:+ start:2427 stop:3176 length:750 start_codon:yes stop_codon:yes gene_type:complete
MKSIKNKLEIFGLQPIIEAIKSGKEFDKIFIKKGLQGQLSSDLKYLIKKNNIPSKFVPLEKINRLTKKNHQGVFGFISPINFHKVGEIIMKTFEEGKTPILLMLDRITDVRNFGAITRSADNFGVDAIIINKFGSAQINSDAIKTSAGAIYKVPICREDNLVNCISYLKKSGLVVISCSEKESKNITDVNLKNPILIILGSEKNGISSDILKASDEKIKIPTYGKIDSLNVSVACGISLYEISRQRSLT